MNKIFLIGNLTRDPELRTTPAGVSVCTFTVAVNRRRANSAEAGNTEADFFRITTWRQVAESCNRYLAKGRKVGVTGTLTLSTYQGNDGQQRASLEVQADEVEFLSPRSETEGARAPQERTQQAPQANQFVSVDDVQDLPF